MHNRFDEALASLSEATEPASPLSRGFAHFAQGQEATAAQSWLQALERPAELTMQDWEGLLFFLDQAGRRVNLDQPLLEAYQSTVASFPRLSPLKRLSLEERIWRLAVRLGRWDEAEQAAGQLGLLCDWQWVAGPFARFGTEDLQEPFGPEKDLSAESWMLMGRMVKRIEPGQPVRLGSLSFEDFLYPRHGVAYAFTQFEVDQGGPALLRLLSDDSIRLWLNGELLVDKNVADLQLSRRQQVPCRFRTGANWILVKSLKTGLSWSFRLGLLTSTGEPLPVRALPGNAKPNPQRVDPTAAALIGEDTQPTWLKTSLSPESNDEPALEQILLLWGALARYDAWERAEAVAQGSIDAASSFALGHRLLGETYIMEANQRHGSRTRLEKQAQEKFEKALELFPGDAIAASYAAQYHISRRTWDEARSVIEACLQIRKSEGLPVPAALWIEQGRVNQEKQFWVEAKSDFKQALQQFPGKSSAVLPLVSLLNQSEGEALAFEVLKQAIQSRLNPEVLRQYLQQGRLSGREAETMPALEHYLEGFPTSRSMQMERVWFEVRGQNWQTALEGLQRLMQQCPDDPEPHFQAAQIALSRSSQDGVSEEEAARAREQAIGALEESLQRAPESFRYREVLRQLRLQASADPQTGIAQDWYTPYDVRVEEIDREALARLPQKRAGAVYLIDSSVMEIFPNGNARSQVHQAILLKNKEGRERFAEMTIPGGNDVRLLWARTYSPDLSQTYEPTSIQDLGGRTAISMFNLEDGSIIDYAYEETASSGQLPGRNFQSQTFYFGSTDDPMLLSRFAVLVPPSVPFHTSTHPDDFEPLVQEVDGRTLYLWEQREVEGIKSEPFQPSLSEIIHTVQFSTTPDYLVAYRSSRSSLLGRREKPQEIEGVASLLALDLETREEKIDTVYDYVQERIEESGLGGQTVYDTYFTGSGRSSDRAFLAQALLEAMGIRSELAFSYDPEQRQGLPTIPAPRYFSGTLLYIPAEDPSGGRTPGHLDDRWLDFSSRYQPPGEINARLTQGYAMVQRTGREFFTVPDPRQNLGAWMATEVEFQLEPDGSAGAKGLLSFFGDLRSILRQQMTNPDLRQRIVDISIGRNLRGIQVERSQVFGEVELPDNLAFGFEGRMPQLLRPAGENYQLNPVLDPASMADLVRDATREHPLEFNSWAKWMPYSISVQLPSLSDWTFLELPEDTVLISDFGVYSLIFNVEGSRLDITRSLIVPPQRIEPKDYGRFAEFCRQVDSAEKREVVIGSRGKL